MYDFRVKESRCVNCKRPLDGALGTDNRPPKAGDVSVCIACGMIMEYGPDLTLKEITTEGMAELRMSKDWQKIVKNQKNLNEFLSKRS